jgi:hypothetical protein
MALVKSTMALLAAASAVALAGKQVGRVACRPAGGAS